MTDENRPLDESKVQQVYQASCADAEKILNDPDKVADLMKKLEKKLKEVPNLGDQLAYLPRMGMMINSYIKKEYLDVSTGSIIAAIGAIIYFVSPIDIIPDFIPVVGLLDDVAIVGLALNASKADIDKYMEWRKLSGKDPEEIDYTVT